MRARKPTPSERRLEQWSTEHRALSTEHWELLLGPWSAAAERELWLQDDGATHRGAWSTQRRRFGGQAGTQPSAQELRGLASSSVNSVSAFAVRHTRGGARGDSAAQQCWACWVRNFLRAINQQITSAGFGEIAAPSGLPAHVVGHILTGRPWSTVAEGIGASAAFCARGPVFKKSLARPPSPAQRVLLPPLRPLVPSPLSACPT